MNPQDLADVVGLLDEVFAEERKPGGALDPATPSTFQIRDLKAPIEAYLYDRRHPLAKYVGPGLVVVAAFALGSLIGRRKARR